MRRRRSTLLAVCVVGGMFAGFAMGGTAGARPVAAVTPSRTITVTQADSGRSYTLHKGDHLDVQLSVPSGFIWTEPASSDQSVLHRTGGSSGSTATGTFVAKSKGKVEVTAIGKPNCSASPCPALLLLFQVNVSVVS